MTVSRNYRRKAGQRLSLFGWFILVALGGLVLLILGSGARLWLAQAKPLSQAVASAPTVTAAPTLQATAVPPTPVNAVPWSAGMWQDARGQWWPQEVERETVQAQVVAHYREMQALVSGPSDEVLQNLSDVEVARHLDGTLLDEWLRGKRRYIETGLFNETALVVDESMVTVQHFSADGLTCEVGETLQAAHLLHFVPETQTWEPQVIPDDGVYEGAQYFGVTVYRMRYDEEVGRWKAIEFVRWIPRETP